MFAFPSRKPVIADIDENALFVREPLTSAKNVKPFLPTAANYPAGRYTFETRTARAGALKPDAPLLPFGLLGPVRLIEQVWPGN